MVPELMLAILSIPIGVAVDALKLSFRTQQSGFVAFATLIALSHLQLVAGGNPVMGVIGLGLGYAVCNQLMWAGFPSVCPQDLMSLGAGIVACFINLGATVVPAVIGTMRAAPGLSPARADAAMFLLFSAFAIAGAVLGSFVARGAFDGSDGDGDSLAYAPVEEDEEEEMELGEVGARV